MKPTQSLLLKKSGQWHFPGIHGITLDNTKLKAISKEKDSAPDASIFPIVGIGASAGGLEAIEQFLRNVPERSGMAYVVVQHLDPTQKGMLTELLQRITQMKVFQAGNNMLVSPNCVYVIPPNKSMSILNGRLQLVKPIETRGLRLPIDYFLRSLAQDRKEKSIGLILSGMGSDGSSGLRAIKENNGVVMVQDPDTAKFNSMPRSAIQSVLVDIIASPEELSEKLMDYFKHLPLVQSDTKLQNHDKAALDKIIFLLRSFTGNDFSQYKESTMSRRIERRMGVHKTDKISHYVNLLQENPKEGEILFKELMIGVTKFFRDSNVWEKLSQEIIPAYITKQPDNSVLRAWVPACSTGEEAYSLAIVFKEALKKIHPPKNISLQIFATDLDNDAVKAARKGHFPLNIEADVSPQLLARYFVKEEESYHVNSEIREMLVFAQHNLIMHPPFIKIDFLSCRNMLIYIDADLQKKILGLFFQSLNEDGIMVLGNSESLNTMDSHYIPLDRTLKIYKRNAKAEPPDLVNFPSSYSRTRPHSIVKTAPVSSNSNIQTLADQLILQHFSPPGVLLNSDADILYISGRTGKYLEPAAGKANLNIFSMLREGLRQEFHVAFKHVKATKKSKMLHNLKVGSDGNSQTLDICIQYIDKPEPLKGTFMIIFSDVPHVKEFKHEPYSTGKSSDNIREKELEQELQYTREEMHRSQSEMQTYQEELKSTNEELQSANEELQSANEELTSSKEEMQSLNEELQTLNAELLIKVEDFARIDNDMKNLLNSTNIATLFLDKELNIRRYTIQATKIFKFIKSDIGRPFTDQVSDLNYPHMAQDAKEVLRTLLYTEKQIPGKDGKWYSVRMMPNRTFDDRVDGLVMTFIDISVLKQMEEKYKEALGIQNLLIDTSTDVVLMLSSDFKVLEFNPEAEKFFGVNRENVIKQDFFQMFVPESAQKKSKQALEKLMNRNGSLKTDLIAAKGNINQALFSIKMVAGTGKMMLFLSDQSR